MLKSLDYSVTFPTTGRCFQNRIEFAPGLTAITGRNEAGKTIVLEMIGYAMFGKAALRGLASDYKDLVVTLEFETAGREVRIERAKKEQLIVDGEVKAVGAEAINKEVPLLLGYGLDVHNIALAAQQGDLGALTEMKPTARSQMINKLVGLDLLEGIEKECKAEAKTQETVALSLLTSTAAPIEPVKPDDYTPVAELEVSLNEVQDHQRERDQLLGIREPVAPVEPIAPEQTDVEALEAIEAERQAALREQAHLEGKLAGMPEPRFSREDLEKAVAYQTYQQEVAKRGQKPTHGKVELLQYQAILDVQAKAADEVECPKCDHHFHPGLTDADEQLLAMTSPLSRGEITTEFRRHELWAEPLDEVAEFIIPNLQQEVLAHAYAEERAEVIARLAKIVVPADVGGHLRAARAYRSEAAVYDARVGAYRGELDRWEAAQKRLGAMPDRSVDLADLQRRIGESRHFDAAVGRFAEASARYDELCARAQDARALGDGYSRGATALRNARSRVKQELAPSLAKSASALLTAMTSGERRHIDVDHDFNIIVDGQPLQTLSGSGKSVVNLALRIGLGQVLTSKVLPIFMGDEIDKDMDAIRATSTHTTFQNLREYLTQIILVTHKEIEADQVISL